MTEFVTINKDTLAELRGQVDSLHTQLKNALEVIEESGLDVSLRFLKGLQKMKEDKQAPSTTDKPEQLHWMYEQAIVEGEAPDPRDKPDHVLVPVEPTEEITKTIRDQLGKEVLALCGPGVERGIYKAILITANSKEVEVSKSEQKRICTQSECAYRNELEQQLARINAEIEAYADILDTERELLEKAEAERDTCIQASVDMVADNAVLKKERNAALSELQRYESAIGDKWIEIANYGADQIVEKIKENIETPIGGKFSSEDANWIVENARQLRENCDAALEVVEKLQDFAIWMTGAHDFAQYEYFRKHRHLLIQRHEAQGKMLYREDGSPSGVIIGGNHGEKEEAQGKG